MDDYRPKKKSNTRTYVGIGFIGLCLCVSAALFIYLIIDKKIGTSTTSSPSTSTTGTTTGTTTGSTTSSTTTGTTTSSTTDTTIGGSTSTYTPIVTATTYTVKPFVQYTVGDTDLPNQPMNDTLVGCQNACTSTTSCIGFSRMILTPDNAVGPCWLKSKFPNPVNNDPMYHTFVKN